MKPIKFCATSVDCVIITTTTVLSRSITEDYSAFARTFEDGGRDFKGRGEDITLIVVSVAQPFIHGVKVNNIIR